MTHALSQHTPASDRESAAIRDRAILILGLISCAAIICSKLALIRRININWDEFHFLSHVYELVRGQLTITLQGAYTHVFRWLTLLPTDEIGQVIAARTTMMAFLCVTCVLIWKLACEWASRSAAIVAPLCYLSMLPIAKHGASFRYDPMLATLSLAALLLIARSPPSRGRLVLALAGVILGTAYVLTPKTVLLIPVMLGLLALHNAESTRPWSSVLSASLTVALAAIVISVVLLTLHRFWVIPAESGIEFAARSVRKTLLDPPLLPQRHALYETLRADAFAWVLLAIGTLITAVKKSYRPALVCSLALLPILFYRNSFSYYYVVMLAPACVLAAVAVDWTRDLISPYTRPTAASWLASAVIIALAGQGLLHLYYLRHDDVERQQAVLDAVHSIFPSPVTYIDHSGAISSFKKANFFMSSWGIENYLSAGKSFVRKSLEKHQPPLLLANKGVLLPGHPHFSLLLPEDQALIRSSYIQYWGPIFVAGIQAAATPETPVVTQVPFSASYRVESARPVLINGLLRKNNEVIHIAEDSLRIVIQVPPDTSDSIATKLIWAGAKTAPTTPPPTEPLYRGL